MHTTSWIIQQADGYKSTIHLHKTDKAPLASIVFLHGMAEHFKRYNEFAVFLNENAIDLYIYNHRGHGDSISSDDLGHFSKDHGDTILVNDGINILKYIDKNKRTQGLFLMGHSMGSLVVRNIIQKYNSIKGIIICGTTCPSPLISMTGLFTSSLIKFFKGPLHRSNLMYLLLFGGIPYKKLCTKTTYDWLTKDTSIIGSYINDPYCGFICTISFYHDLIKLAYKAGKKSNIMLLPKETPVLLMSGDKDPVGDYGKEVEKLYNIYKNLNYTNVTLKLYEDDRHELLNETDRAVVMSDILEWIKKI